MPPAEVLSELQKLAGRIGVAVRYEVFDLRVIAGRGGLCRVKGQHVIVMDAGMPVLDKIGVLADALATFDLDALYVPPFIRMRVQERHRARLARQAARLAR